MQGPFINTIVAVVIFGALGAGSIAYYNPNSTKRWEDSTLLASRIAQNSVAAERFRQANGTIVAGTITDLPAQLGPFGGDFSAIGLTGEAWSVEMAGSTPALCLSATENSRSQLAFQSALAKLNQGFVSSQCGVVGAPASTVRVYTLLLQGAG